MHPAQSRVAELFGSQCGFCTPGVVMSLYGTLAAKGHSVPTMHDIEEGFDGNLCRCTGYRPILDAGKTFACDVKQLPDQRSSPKASTTLDKCLSYAQQNASPINPVKFPEKLRHVVPQSMHIRGSIDWHRPVSLAELLQLRRDYPGHQSTLVFGNTRVQIERKFEGLKCSRLISITHVPELQQIKRQERSLYLGAGVTFTRLKSKLLEWNHPNDGVCQALLDQLKYFASTQIRNVASLGGNIISASPM